MGSNFFIVMLIALNISCVHQRRKNSQNKPIMGSEAENTQQISKIKQIKSLYLNLSEQLSSSQKKESKELAKLAKAAGESADEDVQAFIESGYVQKTSQVIEKDGGDDTPEIIKDEKTKYAAISLISLGALSLGGGLLTLKPMLMGSKSALFFGAVLMVTGGHLLYNPSDENKNRGSYLAFSAGIATVILGVVNAGLAANVKKFANIMVKTPIGVDPLIDELRERLLRDRRHFMKLSDGMDVLRKKKGWRQYAYLLDQAYFRERIEDMVKSLNDLGVTDEAGNQYTVKKVLTMEPGTRNKMFRDVALKKHPDKTRVKDDNYSIFNGIYEDIKRLPRPLDFKTRIAWGTGLAALGAGMIVASKTAFNLTENPSTPYETLQKLNNLIATY